MIQRRNGHCIKIKTIKIKRLYLKFFSVIFSSMKGTLQLYYFSLWKESQKTFIDTF
jgi:hypothetical protein